MVNCQGSGQPVYLIGGGPAFTSWNLEHIQQHLRDRFRVCRWDMRGVGENAALAIKQDSPVLSQWLQDMAEVLPEQPVIIWGHSWGALQSLLFSRLYPKRVKGHCQLILETANNFLQTLRHPTFSIHWTQLG